MKIIHAAKDLKPGRKTVCLAIGFFDGVHLGHQQIIRQTIADARRHGAVALVLTFDRHPNSVVAPQHVPRLIYPLSRKLEVIASLGADALLLIRFDRKFSGQTGEEFVRRLRHELGQIQSLCVGRDFVFGYRRTGDVTLLKRLGDEIGFNVHGMAAVSLDGQVVSSTRIREAIRAGELDAASQMLGRPYTLSGCVVKGDRLGRKLGFPTANLAVTGLTLPPNGVYAGLTRVKDKPYRAAVNIGLRPTIASSAPTLSVEAHLLDFSGDLYDQNLTIEIGAKLRNEKKFRSSSELKCQIGRDVAGVQALG